MKSGPPIGWKASQDTIKAKSLPVFYRWVGARVTIRLARELIVCRVNQRLALNQWQL